MGFGFDIENIGGDVGQFLGGAATLGAGSSLATLGASFIPGIAGYIAASEQRRSDEAMNQKNMDFAREQFDYQKYANENSLEIKLRDAARAGIHPLAALGASPGGNISPVAASQVPTQSDVGNLALMGQDISRSLLASQNSEERMITQLTLQKMGLENSLLETQIMKMQQDMVNQPVAPGTNTFIPGQSNSPIFEKPLERTTSITGYSEPGAVTSIGHSVFPDNSVMVTQSSDLKTRTEDDKIAEAAFHMNARTPLSAPPISALPPGYDMWSWNPITNVFTPDKSTLKAAHKANKGYWVSSYVQKKSRPQGSYLTYEGPVHQRRYIKKGGK